VRGGEWNGWRKDGGQGSPERSMPPPDGQAPPPPKQEGPVEQAPPPSEETI
jgi:hypothetical protein